MILLGLFSVKSQLLYYITLEIKSYQLNCSLFLQFEGFPSSWHLDSFAVSTQHVQQLGIN